MQTFIDSLELDKQKNWIEKTPRYLTPVNSNGGQSNLTQFKRKQFVGALLILMVFLLVPLVSYSQAGERRGAKQIEGKAQKQKARRLGGQQQKAQQQKAQNNETLLPKTQQNETHQQKAQPQETKQQKEAQEHQQEKKPNKEKTSGFLALPVVFYTPETGLALGGGGMYYFRPRDKTRKTRPSQIAVFLMYTLKKQYNVMLNPDLYFSDGSLRVEGNIVYEKYYDKYWGIGPEVPPENEEKYTFTQTKISVTLRKKLTASLYGGFKFEGERRQITALDEAPLLQKSDLLGRRGGQVVGLGVVFTFDSRDNIFFASSGSYHEVFLSYFSPSLGSDFDFRTLKVNLRKYVPLGKGQVLAFQGYGYYCSGETPFYRLAQFGFDNTMRGYYAGRYRDNNFLSFQIEYRGIIWKKWGVAAFVGGGDVQSQLRKFRISQLKPIYGLGIRYVFSQTEKLTLRLDFAWGKDSSGFYFTAAEAF